MHYLDDDAQRLEIAESLGAEVHRLRSREMRDGLRHGPVGRQGLHRRGHDLADAQQVEGIHAVLTAHVVAAPRDFFGEDGTLQQQHRDPVSKDAGSQYRQERAHITRQFHREQRRGQRRAHGPAHHGRHAQQRPEARVGLRQ